MKKILTLILALAMVVSLSCTAFASTLSFADEVEANVKSLLSYVEYEKELYGLSDVDFSTLSLGTEIPAYEVTSDGLVRLDGIHYFPIFSEDEWVATATISYNEENVMNTTISTKYAVSYSVMEKHETNSVALVFTDEKAYLYVGDDILIVETYAPIEGRYSIGSCAEVPDTAKLIPNRELTISKFAQTRAAGDVVALSVPGVKQSGTFTCWAACVASIVGFYNNVTLEDTDVLNEFGLDVTSAGKSTDEAAEIIRDTYGFTYGKGTEPNILYSSLYLENVIVETYINESPIYVGCAVPGASGHAVVIRGYVNSGSLCAISYMDPDDGLFSVASANFSDAITIVTNGKTARIWNAFAVYD